MGTRNRAGRMGYETRVNFSRNVGDFVQSFAAKEWKHSLAETKAMVITRTEIKTGRREVITFATAYGELSMWLNVAFCNTSEDGLSDMLTDTFLSNASVHTKKAIYKLWTV